MPRVFEVNTLSEFISVATWLYSNPTVIFRGQTRDWPLIPSVGRDLARSRCLQKEVEILEEFKRESIPYLDRTPINDWQWLALAQHNRLPTRLLDWTSNPLVAVWFAVNTAPIGADSGVVWAHYYREESALYKTLGLGSPFEVPQTSIYFPEHISPFIRAQAGVFTVHHIPEGKSSAIPALEDSFRDAEFALTKIEIPGLSFPSIRYHLFRVGVSPASLFPGLAGVADKIRYDNVFVSDEISPTGVEMLKELADEPTRR